MITYFCKHYFRSWESLSVICYFSSYHASQLSRSICYRC